MIIPTGPSGFQREVEARIARRFSRSSSSLLAFLLAESRGVGGVQAALMACMVRCGVDLVAEGFAQRPPPRNPSRRGLEDPPNDKQKGQPPCEDGVCRALGEPASSGENGALVHSPPSQGSLPCFDDLSYAQQCLLVWEAAGLLHAHGDGRAGQAGPPKPPQRGKSERKGKEAERLTTAPRMTTRRMTAMAVLSAENSRQSVEEPSPSLFYNNSSNPSSFYSSPSHSSTYSSSLSRSSSEVSHAADEEYSVRGEKGLRDKGDTTEIEKLEPRRYVDYWKDFFLR
ncbi:unnamed protein product [Phytomonas sp. Hart1]|nr:unnamed protein product [Phytomonas sp. Hart1]|eukprot:CCW70725.1 unnamed protein product [Phytomonas sp. isolate Hart1]